MKINLSTQSKAVSTAVIGLLKDHVYNDLQVEVAEFIAHYLQTDKDACKIGNHQVLTLKTETGYTKFIVFGLGEKLPKENELRDIAGNLIRFLQAEKLTEVALYLPNTGTDVVGAVAQGLSLGAYSFELLKKEHKTNSIQEIQIIRAEATACDRQELQAALSIAANVVLARDLTNLPGNLLTPKELAEKAERLAKKLDISCKVLSRKDMEKAGMRLLLSVAQGSDNSPYLVTMHYRGDRNSKELLALVGKGVTFDSGGISIKPSAGMEEMRDDMAGAAAVLAAVKTIAELKLPCNVVAVMPCVENMPSGTATRPGDIIEGMNGKSVEVVNTDAEGRLILADAVYYAEKELGATKIVDIATLTGAASVALGSLYAATITNSDELHQQLKTASVKTGEQIWQLPSDAEYKELIKSDHADLKNSGGRDAGTIVGGIFIGEFVTKDWVHIDIGATVSAKAAKGHVTKGATGYGVRLLVQLSKEVFSC